MNGRLHEEKWTQNGKTEKRNGNSEWNGQTVNGIGNVFWVSTVHVHVQCSLYPVVDEWSPAVYVLDVVIITEQR